MELVWLLFGRMRVDKAFEAALNDDPNDWATRLVYADWLEENGFADYASAQRWMVEEKRQPVLGTGGWIWWWISTQYIMRESRTIKHYYSCQIPHALFKRLTSSTVLDAFRYRK